MKTTINLTKFESHLKKYTTKLIDEIVTEGTCVDAERVHLINLRDPFMGSEVTRVLEKQGQYLKEFKKLLSKKLYNEIFEFIDKLIVDCWLLGSSWAYCEFFDARSNDDPLEEFTASIKFIFKEHQEYLQEKNELLLQWYKITEEKVYNN